MFGLSVEVKLILEHPFKEFYECLIICLFIYLEDLTGLRPLSNI